MSDNKKPLIIITGPTAVGKTELSIALAKRIGGEIISADSMQVYRHMDIGTAKIMPDEMQGVKHYLIDELEPDEEFNVTIFKQKCDRYIEEIYSHGNIPIIVGGTGFYIQAVLYDIDFTKTETDDAYRKELQKFADEYGDLTLCNGIVKTENGVISCTIDIRVPVTLNETDIRKMCQDRLEDKNGRIEITNIVAPLFFPRESPLVNALYKAYTDVTGDTEHKPMVIGGGTYAKSLKNIIAFGPEKEGIDYRIHGADEFILVSGMEEAVLIYMEAIKNLLAI